MKKIILNILTFIIKFYILIFYGVSLGLVMIFMYIAVVFKDLKNIYTNIYKPTILNLV